MRDTLLVQGDVGVDHLGSDPGSRLSRAWHGGAGFDHFAKSRVEAQLEALEQARTELPFLADGTERTGAEAGSEEVANETPGSERDAEIAVDASDIRNWEGDLENTDWFRAGVEKWRKNPGLMLYKLQSNSYKFSWLLIPLSLPFVWVLFAWRREFKAYDHAVFVTYSLGFMSLVFIVLSLMGKVGVGLPWLFTIFSTIAPLHIYRQLKQAYGLSTWSTIWRLVVLLFAIFVVIALFLQILLFLGAF